MTVLGPVLLKYGCFRTWFTELGPCFTEFSPCFTEFRPVPAPCRPLLARALNPDEERSPRSSLSAGDRGGIWVTVSRVPGCAHLSTLRHFDSLPPSMVNYDPLIPCERRLEKSEILEFQEVISGGRFGNRDYGRPFQTFLVTLRRFD